MHARAEVRHQVAERAGLPALVERLEALGHAVGGRRDLIGVDRVELLRARRRLRIPEDQRARRGSGCRVGRRLRGVRRRGFAKAVDTRARLQTRRLNRVHTSAYRTRPVDSYPAQDTPAAADTSESAGPSRARPQRRKRAPRSVVIRRAWLHESHSPDWGRPCRESRRSSIMAYMFTSEATTRGHPCRGAQRIRTRPIPARPAAVVLPVHDHHHQRGRGHRAAALTSLDHYRRRRPSRGSQRPGCRGPAAGPRTRRVLHLHVRLSA